MALLLPGADTLNLIPPGIEALRARMVELMLLLAPPSPEVTLAVEAHAAALEAVPRG